MSDRAIEWVVLDLGETLVDERRNWDLWAAYLGVAESTFHAALGATIAERRVHTDVFEYFRPGFDLTLETSRRAEEGLGWVMSDEDLYPDALPMLRDLRARGYRLAVMANQPREVHGFLESLPLDTWATSAAWGVTKPDRRFFERVLLETGATPEAAVYVGDRVDLDVVPAADLGMATVHLRRGPWGVIQSRWPEADVADARIDDLSALVAVLDSWS